jgi:hypothetical protein
MQTCLEIPLPIGKRDDRSGIHVHGVMNHESYNRAVAFENKMITETTQDLYTLKEGDRLEQFLTMIFSGIIR